jgi:hypothetical protein
MYAKPGEDKRLKALLGPAFQSYKERNLGLAQRAVKEAAKKFVDENENRLGITSASNRFLSFFARQHLMQRLDPRYLYDSEFTQIQPNGLYVRSGAYILLTRDDRFFIQNFAKEERSWMSKFMDLYEAGFSKQLVGSE